jgi:hypothetical protein
MIRNACLLTLLIAVSARAMQADHPRPATQPPGTTEPAKPATPPGSEESPKPASPDKPAEGLPKGTSGSQLRLTGIRFIVPAGWETQQIQPGAMAPKAVYQIPPAKAGEEPGMIRITHYPEMKGKDDSNIDRWIGQVTKPDGAPATRADAKVEKVETGNIRLTTVDVSGTVKMTMRDTAKPDHRMIAAIVDHPKGPHFVVAAGPAASMKTWEADILKFLKSAEVKEK